MKKSITYSGQRWKKEILDWLQTSKEEAIKERFSDYISPGVVPSSASQFSFEPGTANTYLSPRLTINPGIAYNALGDRIAITDVYDDFINPDTYLPDNPNHVTDNGLSINVPTPRSTGSTNIPLTVGIVNKIWIGYLSVIDDTLYTLRKTSLEKQFYQQMDGYHIVVSLTNPDISTYVYLGQVDLTNSIRVETTNIDITGRTIANYSITAISQGSGSGLDADLLDGKHATSFQLKIQEGVDGGKEGPNGYAGLDSNGFITMSRIPQGDGSTLNADTVDGIHAMTAADAVAGSAGDRALKLVALNAGGQIESSLITFPAPAAPVASPAPFRYIIQGIPETITDIVRSIADMNCHIIEMLTYVDKLPTGSSTLTITFTINGAPQSTVTYNSSSQQAQTTGTLNLAVLKGNRIGVSIAATVVGGADPGGQDLLVSIAVAP